MFNVPQSFLRSRGSVRDLFSERALVRDEPVESFLEARKLIDRCVLEYLHREERDDPNQGSNTERNVRPIDRELIVVKSIKLIPEPSSTEVIDG